MCCMTFKMAESSAIRSFLIDNPDAIQIILYQDSFEVVNPLGSAKKKHKILAVYYSVGKLHASVRSLIDNMQPVVLCKEENFKMLGREAQDVVFGPLLNDLKKMNLVLPLKIPILLRGH